MEKLGQLDSKSKIWEPLINWNISVVGINVTGLDASVQIQKFWVKVKENSV